MPLSKKKMSELKQKQRNVKPNYDVVEMLPANPPIFVKPKSGNVKPNLEVTDCDVKEMLTRPNRMGANGSPEMVVNEYDANERLSDGRMRYLGPFSDGQALDRTTVSPIDRTTEAYRVFSKCKMFTPNVEQLRENGIDLKSLMEPSGRQPSKRK